MNTGQAALIRRHLHRLTSEHGAAKLQDRDLLDRFIERRDESAFEMLVERHGPMVLRVCRRVLVDRHAADDVFQATFLVLLRKAKTLNKRDLLANWLYGVAYRLALRSRTDSFKRHNKEARLQTRPQADLLSQVTGRELCHVLDEELQRLPERFRNPFLLCFEEGQTQDQAARQLGCSLTTLKRRLEKGRELLRTRLVRHGLTLSGVLVAAGISQTPASAAVPVLLLVATTRLASHVGGAGAIGPISAPIAELAEGALRAMMVSKAKVATAFLMTVVSMAVGAGTLAFQARAISQANKDERAEFQPPPGKATSDKPAQQNETPNDFFGDPLPAGSFARIGTSRLRHGHHVKSIAYSKDGRYLVSAGNDHLARLWDVETGKEVRNFGQQPDRGNAFTASRWIHSVALSPDGKLLATGEYEPGWPVHTIRLWDVETGNEIRKIEGHKAGVTTLAFSPDSKTLASGSADKTVRLWQVATGDEQRTVTNHVGEIAFVAFAKDGASVFTAGDRIARHLETLTGKELHMFSGHDNDIKAGALSPDGKTLATGDSSGVIRVWDIGTGKERLKLTAHEKTVRSLAFSPDSTFLASGGDDRRIHLWDPTTGKPLPEPKQQLNVVNSLAFAPNGKTLASVGWANPIHFWEVATGKEKLSMPGHEDAVVAFQFSANGKELNTWSRDWSVRRWDTATGKELKRLTANWAIALTPDGRAAFSGGEDGLVRLVEIDSGKEIRQYKGHQSRIEQLAVSRDGNSLASKSLDKTIRFWDVATAKEIKKIDADLAPRCIEFSSDRKMLAIGVNTPEVRLVDVITGKEIRQFNNQQGMVWSLAFSGDGNYLATGDQNGKATIWEVASGKPIHEFPGHNGYVHALAFSSDSRTLAVGGWSKVILWELASDKQRAVFTGFPGDVTSLEFRPDSRALASGCGDTTIMLWDLSGRSLSGPLAKQTLEAKELEAAWDDLASLDAAQAFHAIGKLAASPEQAKDLIAKNLHGTVVGDPKLVAQLIKDLDNDDFDARDKASSELEKLGEAAEPAIREAYKKQQSAEVHLRLEVLLSKLDGSTPSAGHLRQIRSLEVLELLNNPESVDVLKTLAKGPLESRLTKEVKAALGRLAKK